eukprot:jgi/Mesen1/9821/ME000007S09885
MASTEVSLLGIVISNKPKWAQLLICGGGFFVGYLVNGVCEEYVYNHLRFSSYGWYFSAIHAVYYLLLLLASGFRPKHVQNPWSMYWKLSAVMAGSHGLTKSSLQYLNYPAQLIFKSTKVLPVMLMGSFIPGLRRKYTVRDYIGAAMLVVGLIAFTLADAQSSPIFNVMGVIMVVAALVLDAFLGNLQEVIFTANPATTQMEMLFCSTLLGLPFLLPPMILTGEVFVAVPRCWEHPHVYLVLFFEACCTYIGQLSVLSLIVCFGAATTAMVTTARKAVTLCISYMMFTKPFLEQHVFGLLLLSGGIILKMLPEGETQKDKAQYLPVVTEELEVPEVVQDTSLQPLNGETTQSYTST